MIVNKDQYYGAYNCYYYSKLKYKYKNENTHCSISITRNYLCDLTYLLYLFIIVEGDQSFGEMLVKFYELIQCMRKMLIFSEGFDITKTKYK